MTKFDISATFVAPPEHTLTDDHKAELRSMNLSFNERDSTDEAIADADVIYIETTVQPDFTVSREEAEQKRKYITPEAYRITMEMLANKAKRDVLILHALPRFDEVPVEIDNTRHAGYWYEAYNCMLTRMALLALILGAME